MKKIMIILLVLVSCSTAVFSKDFDFAITPQVGFDQGWWRSGQVMNIPSNQYKEILTYGVSTQAIYNKWDFYGIKPVFEFQYKRSDFDFRTYRPAMYYFRMSRNLVASEQQDIMNGFSFRVGGLKEFEFLSIYGLIGTTIVTQSVRFVETYPQYRNHGNPDMTDWLLSLKFGVFKLWPIANIEGYDLKMGPEISIEILPWAPGFSRCRTFSTLNVVPNAGLRIQW